MTLKAKFIILGVLLFGVTGFCEWLNLRNVQLSETKKTVVEVIQRHMEADMMHDGMRGNVYSAMMAVQLGDANLLRESVEEVSDMSAGFKEDVNKNVLANTPDTIRQAFKKVQGSLENYVRYSKLLAASATNKDEVVRLLPEFNRYFDILEKDQGSVSNLLLGWSDNLTQDSKTNALYFDIALLTLLTLAIGLPLFAVFGVFKPFELMIREMQKLAHGDVAFKVSYTNRKDEVGFMGQSLNVFKENALDKARLEEEQLLQVQEEKEKEQYRAIEKEEERKQKEQEQQEAAVLLAQEQKRLKEELASSFEQRMQGIIQSVVSVAKEMTEASKALSESVSNSSSKAENAKSATSLTTSNVKNVAVAVDEMSATITEIAKQVADSAKAVRSVMEQVSKVDETSSLLSETTNRIGGIVETIHSITGQINLLALNATIESASAGDAGKGFAVVANEIKVLATQTRGAATEIADSIRDIQGASKEVVSALGAIKTSVENVDQIAVTIANAVEEQSVTTTEISSNMTYASQGVININTNIEEVSQAASNASSIVLQSINSTRLLSEEATKLNLEVNRFLAEVRR
jgi:methyl-accepting chemotaxis protein